MSISSSVFIATSLDGYIARDDGSIDWLERANAAVPEGEDCGYHAFMASVDVLVMGRNTFEKVLSFDGWPYGAKPVVVLSRSQVSLPASLPETVSVSSEHPQLLVKRLESGGAQHLYVDGGMVIQSFLRAGLITNITVTVVPVLLGSGRRLFGPLDQEIELIHVATKAYDFGFVQTTYRVVT